MHQRRWMGWSWMVALVVIGCSSTSKGNKDAPLGGAGTTAQAAGNGGASGNTAGVGGSIGSDTAGTASQATDGDSGAAIGGSSTGSDTTDAGDDTPVGPATGPFPPVTDFEAPGPYESTTLANVGPNGTYTVYLPKELAPNGAKNPIVGWMSGGSTSHTGYPLLPHLATHGFVVVASNSVPGIGQEEALGKEIIAGIDWAIAENERADSMLHAKLDTKKVASMGYSMGSLATFTIADDPRLTTTLHISGGNMVADRVNKLRAPAAFICGIPGDASCNILSTTCDIAGANCATDFANATTPVFYARFEGGHLGILTAPLTSQITGMSTAWLRYKLMSDTTLEAMFVGDKCEYCEDTAWKVQQKKLP